MIAQIAYTNSNCSDVWDMFIKENLSNTWMRLHIISDKKPETTGYDGLYLYSNDDAYYNVWTDALRAFNERYFIYLQEDFILYDWVKENKIEEYVNFLRENPNYSFVRLFKCTSFKEKRLTDTLYDIESDNKNVFAMQATIWRTEDYLKLINSVRNTGWLGEGDYRKHVMKMSMKGAYHYDGEHQRGKYHYGSNVYPHIATALVKGKWNLSGYPNELGVLIQKYNIDVTKRGFK